MLTIIQILFVSMVFLVFVGAIFDIDWIMKMTRADRSFGRKPARIIWGTFGFFAILMVIFTLLS